MKQSRGTSQPDEVTLTDFKNLLRGSGRPFDALKAYLPRLRLVDYPAGAQWLSTTPFRGKTFRIAPVPRSYAEISYSRVLPFLNVGQWAAWTAGLVVANRKLLTEHLELYDQLSAAFLEENYSRATDLLGAAETRCGHSIWTLQLQIALKQLIEGFDAQKQYVRFIGEQAGNGSVVNYLAHYTSFRNESAISARYFRSEYLRHLSAMALTRELETCARYHLLREIPTSPRGIADLLSVDTCLSLVDHFEAFLAVAAVISIDHEHLPSDSWRSSLRQIADSLPNSRLRSIAFATTADIEFASFLTPVELAPFDSFLRGEYATAATRALELGNDVHGSHIDYDELAACALAVGSGPREQPTRRIAKVLSAVMSKHDEGPGEYQALRKIEGNAPFPWALKAAQTAAREIADTPNCDAFFLHNSFYTPPTTLNPYHAYTFPTEARLAYLSRCRDVYGDSLSVEYVLSQFMDADAPSGVASDIELLSKADSALRLENYPQAIEAAAALEIAGSTYFRQKAVRIHARSLLGAGDIETCIHFITSIYVTAPNLSVILPIPDVVAATTEETRQSIAGSLSAPLLYDMYSRSVDKQQESTRRFAYEDFLLHHGVSRPSELLVRVHDFDPRLLIYFLRFVCVPEIMDVSPVFDKSKDVEDERLAVCNMLADLDPDNKDVYQAEIRDILIRHSIQKGIRQVEQSKIFVDEGGVRQAVLTKYRETYNRLKAFGRYDAKELAEVARALKKVTSGNTEAFLSLQVEKNEKNDILADLLIGIRDEYVIGPDHGLDGYLSVRIRHGTFGAQLRSPLEAHHLATQRDKDTGVYKPNDYWSARVLTTNEEVRALVGQTLADLSRRFDELTSDLVRTWIQVARDSASLKHFNFTLAPPHLRLAAALIGDRNTLEDFIEDIFGILRGMLRQNCENIRTHLLTSVTNEIDSMLMDTQEACTRVAGGDEIRDLLSALRASRADMRRATSKMADWFKLPSATSTVPFGMDSAISIAVELVRSMYRREDFQPAIAVSDQTLYKGVLLPAFVDLFMIMFENIIKHSGTRAAPATNVSVSRLDAKLQIAVINDVSPTVRTPTAIAGLESIRLAIRAGVYMRSIGKEGGTGLFKMQKIIKHDLAGSAKLAFDFGENDRFYVNIEMPVTEMAE